MNETLMDQIPNLALMLRSLEELSILNVQTQAKGNPFIVQQVPEIRVGLTQGRDWKEIAAHQLEHYFLAGDATAQEDMKAMAELYGQSQVEGLLDGFKCEKCQKEAAKRCSRCKLVWYCSKECQVRFPPAYYPTAGRLETAQGWLQAAGGDER